MSSAVGMMKFPIYGKQIKHVPNHQPAILIDTGIETNRTWC
jgi:hypothetical protein